MESKVTSVRSEAANYPCLMHSIRNKAIILFTSQGTGTVVSADESDYLGKHSRNWDMSRFEPFHGAVELTEE